MKKGDLIVVYKIDISDIDDKNVEDYVASIADKFSNGGDGIIEYFIPVNGMVEHPIEIINTDGFDTSKYTMLMEKLDEVINCLKSKL